MNLTYTFLKRTIILTTGVLCAAAGLLTTACDRHDTSTPQGAAEKAGDDLRSAARDASDKTRNAAKEANKSLTGSDLKTQAKEAADKAGEALRKTGETVREAADKAGQAIEKAKDDLKSQTTQ